MTAAELSSMKKTNRIRTICAISSGVMWMCSVRVNPLARAPLGGQRASALFDVRLVFVAEVRQGREHRRHRGIAERAERLAGDVGGDARQQIEIARLPLAALDLAQ